MPVTLTRFVFAAAVACAAVPGWGAGMPDYGTKNFSPGGATPSYFTNENSAVFGAAENENTDDGADTPTRTSEPTAEPLQSDRTTRHHYGKLSSRNSTSHAAAHSRGKGHASQLAGVRSARPTSTGRSKPSRSEH